MTNNIAILGFTFPENMIDLILRDEPNMPIQTLNFSDNLRQSLESAGFNLILASTHPVTNYPGNSNIFFGFTTFKQGSTKGLVIPFVNVLLIKHITRFLSGYILLNQYIDSFKYETLIIHGIHSPFLLIGYILKKRYNIKTICIVTDPPSNIEKCRTFEKLLRRLDRDIIFFFLKRMDGIITLSELFIDDHSIDIPYLVLDGFADMSLTSPDEVKKATPENERYRFAYAGGLNEEYGVKNLVEAAIQVPEIDLYIYGKGPLHEYLLTIAGAYDNIKYEGFIHPKKLKKLLLLADCLINPRPSNHSFVRYSFPSKILEYMSLGVPLLTTKLPSLSNDYFPHIYIIDDETVTGISNQLKYITTQSRDTLVKKGRQGRAFIIETRSNVAQGLKLKNFINSI